MTRAFIKTIDHSPLMMGSWDFSKNIDNPTQIKQNSNLRYWWLCPLCKYSWLASVDSRRKAKSSCRHCAIKQRDARRLSKTKSLVESFPKIANEWDKEKNKKTAESIFPSSRIKAYWKCSSCGNAWQSRVDHRVQMGSGCPECSKEKRLSTYHKGLLASRDSLEKSFPKIAREWDLHKNLPLTPDLVLPKSSKRVWWRCIKGHSWRATPANRTGGNTGCPFCNSQTSELEIRFYAELDKLLGNALWRAKIEGVEIDILFPSLKLGLEIDGYPWHEGKEDQDNRKTQLLKNIGYRLMHIRHELLKPLSKEDIIFYKNKPYKEVLVKVVSRLSELGYVGEEEAKAYASGAFINQQRFDEIMSWLPGPLPGTSLQEVNPSLASEWMVEKNVPLTTKLISIGSSKNVWWRCLNGHEWQASVANRIKGSGCAACSKRRASKDHNLEFSDKKALKYWDYSRNEAVPAEITPKSKTKAWWSCLKGHSFEMPVKDFVRTYGCPVCSGKRVTKENSLAANLPELVRYWDGIKNQPNKPTNITSSSGKRVWWLCPSCRHSWEQSPNSLTRRLLSNYCPECRKN